MLDGTRIIDLTDEWGLMAGSVLASLGADVVQVEPPGGSPARRLGPFAPEGGPDGSLFWWGYARNKRSVVLDLESTTGRANFLSLLGSADCLLESSQPGTLDAVGLGHAELSARFPALIMTSITPFGQTGPKSRWPASDLTVMSASGYQLTTGDHDRAPLRIRVPQAYAHGAMAGVAGTLIALRERRQSGRGQHVDVSAQEAAAACAIPSQLAVAWGEASLARRSGGYMVGDIFTRTTFPASDGFVSISFTFGSTIGPASGRLIDWIFSEGGCDASIHEKDYIALGLNLMTGVEPLSELARIQETVAQFTATKTKAELLAAAQRFDLLIAPCSTVDEIYADAHLNARQFFEDVDMNGTSVSFPGRFANFSSTPLPPSRRAPRLGEHTAEVLEESARETRPVVPPPGPAGERNLPLQGLKVLDFGWAMVEPSSMRVLADYGATVIKVESTTRFDTLRAVGSREGVFDPDRSVSFQDFNAGKLGLALDLGNPKGQEVIRRLAARVDVLGEAFTPAAMRRWGLDYESLRKLNPRLIYLSTCLGGQTGPYSNMAGYGNLSAALTGFNALCGWPDRSPAGPNGYYTDYVAPPFVVAAVLAALEHRDRTGAGQHIDIAQIEAPLHFLTPALLDFTVNGRVTEANGNQDDQMAPHGLFRCQGDDRWVAIAVEDDASWVRFCDAAGLSGLARDDRFSSVAGRKQHEDALEATVEAWTTQHSAEWVQDRLLAAGIPAHVVSGEKDLFNDPQLQHRGHLATVQHSRLGDIVVEATRWKLSATPGRTLEGAPTIGEHSFEILSELAGYSPDEIADLAAGEVLR